MSLITCTAKALTRAVDCRALTPAALQGKSAAEIGQLALAANLKVADAFDITVDDNVAASELLFKKTTAQHHYLGFAMNGGLLTIDGDAGDFLGAQLQNGVLICKGNAGDRTGDRMRRGLLLIEGNAGDYCASDMLAGTLGVLGSTGDYVGYGMRRGTLLLAQAPKLSATWVDCGPHQLPFLNILYQSFKRLDSRFAQISSLRVQRWMGDMAGIGKAEVLLLK